jgi:hypothetical protein
MEPTDGGGTRVTMHTDLSLSGQAAQMGRGMIADVSQRLAGEFADCVADQLRAPSEAAAGAAAESAGEASAAGEPAGARPAGRSAQQPKAVGGIRLGLWALWRAVRRGVRRLLGREAQ